MQISVVIPAYDAAKYLNRCIESVAKQDLPYDCYEVIVINDGSTDDTVAVLDSLCDRYSFLKYVTVANAGVSCARNRGIVEASGEYLLFLDADDRIFPNTLRTIYQEMTSNRLDMMLMNYLFTSVHGECLKLPYHMEENSRETVSGREFLLKDSYPPLLWIYAYRRSFLLANELIMIPIRHEDEEFIPRAIYKATRIKYFPLLFYNYLQNADSYMSQYSESDLLHMVAAMGSLNRFGLDLPADVEGGAYFRNHVAVIIMRMFKQSIRHGYQNQKYVISEVKKAGLLPLKPRKVSFYYCLFNLSPSLFEVYYRSVKRKPKQKR